MIDGDDNPEIKYNIRGNELRTQGKSEQVVHYIYCDHMCFMDLLLSSKKFNTL